MNFTVYRANKTNNGAATKLEMTKNGVFLIGAKQTGTDANDNANFGWPGKDDSKDTGVTMKLGLTDIGELLAVLRGKKNSVGGKNGLYHQNKDGNTTMTFAALEKDGNKYYAIRLAAKKDKLVEVKHTISIGEGCILETMLASISLKLVAEDKKKKGP